MSDLKVRFSDRVLAVFLAALMVIGIMPLTAFASVSSVLTTDIGEKEFVVGTATEFTFTTKANDDKDIPVVGTSDFSDSDAIEKLEYYEVNDGNWYTLSGDFGPSSGFPMSDATSRFRVTFKKAGDYTFTASMKYAQGDNKGETLCTSGEIKIHVSDKTGAALTTDIGDKDFVVGEATEFTFTTKANDDKDIPVVGSSDFSDSDAIEKLEYYEVKDGNWYTLSGDFGPSSGFPMSDATSRFRVTFKKAGDYTFTASMKYAQGDNKGEALCTSGEIKIHVKDKFNVSVSKEGDGTVTVNGTENGASGIAEGTAAQLSVIPDENWQIASVTIGDEIQTITDASSFKKSFTVNSDTPVSVTFVRVYTVVVQYESENGSVTVNGDESVGDVIVTQGENIAVKATPKENFRVAGVTVNKSVSNFDDNGYNSENPYTKDFSADRDYEIVVTFAPFIYKIQTGSAEHGAVSADKETVDYGGETVVTVKPDKGYTVASAEVNGVSVYGNIKETDIDDVFEFSVGNISEDINIEVTFKECEPASPSDFTWNESDALRTGDGNIFVFKDGDKAVFKTNKQGIRITLSDGTTIGGKDVQSVEIAQSAEIEKIELRYDLGWHEVKDGEQPVCMKIVFDNVKPTAEITVNTSANAYEYYNNDVLLTVSANDSGDYSGIASIKYWVCCDGNESEPTTVYTYEDGTEVKAQLSIEDVKIIASENDSGNVVVYAQAKDRAGNVSEKVSLELKICTISPRVTITFDDKQSEDANNADNWYNDNRTATITVNDREDVFDETAATNGISFADGSADGYSLSEWENNGDVHTAKVTFTDEGSYNWSFAYTNKAGLDAAATKKGEHTDAFGIDKTAPFGTITVQSASWDSAGIDWSMLLEKLTFGLYSNKEVTVGLKAGIGSDLLSGFQKVTYYVSNSDDALTESELIELYENDEFVSDSITISNDEQFSVYARIVDNAGNTAFIGTNGVIYDKTAGEISIAVTDKPNDDSFYGVNNVKEYTAEDGKTIRGINADIEVTDIKTGEYYSGIKKVEYTVSCGETQTQSGTLFEFKNINPEKKDLVKDWSGSVVIDADKNNGKNITLTVTVTDNAGNTSDNSVTIKEINLDDIKAIVIMSEEAVMSEGGFGWYDESRTAYVTITDRASTFDAEAAVNAVKFTITDKDGNETEASADDVTVGKWVSSDNTHSAFVKFNSDGKYSWYLDYTNKAGNKLSEENISYGESESPKSFTIDRTAPDGSVKVGENTWAHKILSVLTFGLYSKTGFGLSVDAYDDGNISPITVKYYKHSGSDALSSSNLDSLYNSGYFSENAPDLTGEQQFTVYVRITDNAGNYTYVSSDGHVIDETQAEPIVAALDQPNENGIYGLNEVHSYGDIESGIRVSVSAKEADSEADVYAGLKEISYEVKSRNSDNEEYNVTQSGILYSFNYERNPEDSNGVKLTITDVNSGTDTYDITDNVPTKDMLCREWAGCIVVDADKNNACDVAVTVKVTDNAGNESSKMIKLDIDITAPAISVSYDNNYAQNAMYFNAPRTVTVVFTERSHHFDEAAAEKIITDSITAVKSDGTEVEDAYSVSWTSDLTSAQPDSNTFTATVSFEKDAHYTFGVSCTDKAGNANVGVDVGDSVAPYEFVVDTEDPSGTVSVNGNTWSEFLETLTFGLYSNSAAMVSASGADEISPVTVEYYKSDRDLGLSKVDLAELDFVSNEEFEISTDEQFSVYVKVTDYAGNVTLLNSDGYIVDTVKSAVSITPVDKANVAGIYGLADVQDYSDIGEAEQGIKVHIDVNETDETVSSGIASIKYAVIAEMKGNEVTTQTGTLYDFGYIRDSGDNSNGGKLTITDANTGVTEKNGQTPVKSELRTSWSGDIIVDAAKNNSSKVYVRVTVTDNAGNVTDYTSDDKAELKLDIDLTAPTVSVSFDNNSALNEKYFNEVRTATVVITERPDHFNAEKAAQSITVTAKNNISDVTDAYVISGWTLSENEEEPDKSTWTATVDFNKDAQYTFDIAYADEANNANTQVSFGESIAPSDFVIDTPDDLPYGTVTVDGNRWSKFLSVITFGLYSNSAVSVSATGGDNTSPVTVEYYKSGEDVGLSEIALDSMEFVSYEPFEISADEQFSVYVKVTDYAGNAVLLNSDGYIVDTVKSAVRITPVDKANDAGIYGPDEVKDYEVNGETVNGIKVHIDVNETDETANSGIASVEYEVVARLHGKDEITQTGTLYDFDYIRDSGDNSNGGKLTITDANTGVTEKNGQTPVKSDLLTSWSGDIIVDAAKNNGSKVYVRVTVTDNAGNITNCINTESAQAELDIDLTSPSISVSFDNNNVLNEKYFNAQRTATVTITERTEHFNAAKATEGIVITAKDAKGNDIENAYVINGWKDTTNENEPDVSTHTATVFFKEDANYTFSVSYTDQAENVNTAVYTGESKAPYEFTVDTVDPYGTVKVNDSIWSEFFDTLTFGLFNNKEATVSATADDATSPVKIEYFKSNDDFGRKEADISSLELIETGDYTLGKNEKLFNVSATEQFNVYVKITDKAGHVVLINSDGYIVDTQESSVSVYAVTQANENGVYGIGDVKENNGVKLHIDANDTEDGAARYYSGIASVSYKVTAELNGKTVTTQEETLYEFKNSSPAKSELLTNWSGDIIVDTEKNNSSKVLVTVTVRDNAGNTDSDSIELDIDVTAPTVDVTFNNNTALNKSYFNAPRTATVVITERSEHFSSAAATNGIVVTAVDAEGNKVDGAYEISGWTEKTNGSNPDKTTHTATVSFSADANYTFAVSYTGKSGNSNAKVNTGSSVEPYKFTVDTTVPDATVSVNDHIWDKLLNILTFGLYSRVNAEVKVDATDKTSPIKVEYYKTNDPVVKSASALDKLYADGKFVPYKSFTVNTNEQFTVYIRITDNAGNYKYISTDGYIVDLVSAELSLTPDAPNGNNVYNKDVNIKIEASDAQPYSGIAKVEYWVLCDGEETQRKTLFSFDYTREDGENTNNGTLKITDWSTGSEKVTELTGNVPKQEQLVSDWSGSFTVDSSLNNSSNVRVYVGVTDNAGNYKEQNVLLDIDVTAPAVKVSYDSEANGNAKDGYYTERTATVVITERTNHFDAAAATNGITVTAVDAKGAEVENAYTVSAWTTTEGETPDSAEHTAVISYIADANYKFAVAYTDKADNKNISVNTDGQENPYEFTVDKTAPVGTVTAKSAEGRTETWSSVVDTLTFGFWSNSKISVSGTSDDATSPIASVDYYMPVSEIASDNTTVLKKAELDEINEWKSFKAFDVTANTQFTVYIRITDNAGNYTYISTNGLIVDDEHPVEESVAPEISVSPAKPVNGIYSSDVKVSIKVEDPMVGGTYSGLKEVSYAVFDRDSATPGKPTQEGTLFTFDMAYPKQSDLQQEWTGEITVSAAKNNSNNIQLVVYAKDNSLNAVDNSQKESRSYTVIKIDTTAPVIDIAYDNNNADSGTYFKANRTAVINVTERNFDAKDVKVTVTNTDGAAPAVIGWTHTAGTYNRDDAVHTATVTYASDGDYTFAIEYTDLAGNKCTKVNYAPGTAAPTAFTVDKTIPTVSVSYDNNSAQNTNYYRDSRTATIVVNEHNFSTDRVNITMTATNDGSAATAPSVSGWSNNGNTHTATVTFSNDALYTFDIAYSDLAGNTAADYMQDTFYVDNTDPVLVITPESLNNSANSGEVKPIITLSDTNFDASQVQITLVGVNRGEVKQLNGSYSDIHNGRVFSFENFAEEKGIDDIYTLSASVTDKAGRSISKSVTFSVNRFGSTYSMDNNTKKLNSAYVKKAQDIVITEINANALLNIKVTLFKNNETIVLKQGTDYRINETGGNGQWYKYVYTIFADNFADDGVYRLSVHSEDAAGNVAENTLDTKDMEINFGVDSTLPIININNLEDGETYALDNMTVLMSISDNLSLTKVTVYLDGNEYQSWAGDSIAAVIDGGGNFSFDISGNSTDAHTLKVVAVDAAGNELTKEVKNFYITTNLWVRYYNNKAAFYGSIAGVVAVAGLVVFLVVWKRRKDEKNT